MTKIPEIFHTVKKVEEELYGAPWNWGVWLGKRLVCVCDEEDNAKRIAWALDWTDTRFR
jgi:hypothetical protein